MLVAGTGHRPEKLGGYDREAHKLLVNVAIRALKECGATEVITGMALGWDQALAEAAIAVGIPFVAAIPFQGQERRWPDESRKKYHRILSHAADLVVVSEGEYAAWKLHRRNEWMVDHASAVLAMWDETSFTGGTAACLKYARKKEKSVFNAWGLFQMFVRCGDDAMVLKGPDVSIIDWDWWDKKVS